MAPSTYPDYRHGNSIDSDRTASDATIDDNDVENGAPMRRYRDDENASDGGGATNSSYPPAYSGRSRGDRVGGNDEEDVDDDLEEGKLRLDQEEEVGLMQLDRDSRGLSSSSRRASLFGARRGKGGRGGPPGGLLVFVGVLAGFVFAIPLLQWLSSTGSADVEAAQEAASAVLSNGASAAANGPKKVASSTNDDAGHWGLAHLKGAHVSFQVPGWDTIAQASAGTGLPEEVVTSFKTSDGHDLMPLDLDIVLGGTLRPQEKGLAWSAEDPDVGVYSHVDWAERDIYIEDVTHARKDKTGEGEVAKGGGKVLYVRGKDVRDHQNHRLTWTRYKISPDMKWVMFFSNEKQQWRHSRHANVWLHNVQEKKTIAIGDGPSSPPTVAYADWAPLRRGGGGVETPGVAYVQGNNLFYMPKPDARPVKVTNDGDTTIFNAVPDWVYEEEVFSGDSAMWFSPGGTKLVFLRLDETEVPVFEFPIYNPDPFMAGKTTPYLQTTKMRYPKPGFPNPLVSVHLVDLDELHDAASRAGGAAIRATPFVLASPSKVAAASSHPAAHDVDTLLSDPKHAKERLVTEVSWLNDDELLVRETDRYSDVMRIVRYPLGKEELRKGHAAATSAPSIDLEGEVVRRDDARKGGKGWIRAAQTLEPLTHHNISLQTSAYLDIVTTPAGFRHLALFASSKSAEPVFLTEGRWEIDELVHVDPLRRKAFFIAARPSPAERHLYSVDLPDFSDPARLSSGNVRPSAPQSLTDDAAPGYYDASFDPKGAYYVLKYRGPDVPYSKVVSVDDPSWTMMLEDNELLRKISSQYVRPQSVFYNLTVPGTTLGDGSPVAVSVKELRPHDFDPSGRTQYPVLVQVYGGPDSQLVHTRWDRGDWHQYLATGLGYIVATIDGRGTGFKGQHYRAAVARNLGEAESRDVNAAARLLSSLPYVDARRLGVWGWSYGGYLANKVVERNASPSSHLFNLSMAVAPVTKWEFYDSVYTERYLKSPLTNAGGYENATVHVGRGHQNVPLLLLHGSGDDNVHFENSAHLVDLLTKGKVRNWRFRMFTDSAHSMQVRGASRELYEEMTRWLVEKWGEGRRRVAAATAGEEGGKAKGSRVKTRSSSSSSSSSSKKTS